jgi:hypothetical protein
MSIPTARAPSSVAERTAGYRDERPARGARAENLRLGEAAADGVTEFLLVIAHARLRGATGAWIAPLALT